MTSLSGNGNCNLNLDCFNQIQKKISVRMVPQKSTVVSTQVSVDIPTQDDSFKSIIAIVECFNRFMKQADYPDEF